MTESDECISTIKKYDVDRTKGQFGGLSWDFILQKDYKNDVSRKRVTQFIDSIATIENVYFIVVTKNMKKYSDKDDESKLSVKSDVDKKEQQRQK